MDRQEWRRSVKEKMQSVNEREELKQKKQKDDKKRRREGQQMATEAALHCEYPECAFVAQSWSDEPHPSEASATSAQSVRILQQDLQPPGSSQPQAFSWCKTLQQMYCCELLWCMNFQPRVFPWPVSLIPLGL